MSKLETGRVANTATKMSAVAVAIMANVLSNRLWFSGNAGFISLVSILENRF